MKKLLLSALRSLKKSKVSIIGLTLLVFFTSLTFTLMNDTSKNLGDTYRKVERQGKLHDFYVKQNFALPTSNVEILKDATTYSERGESGKGFLLNTDGAITNATFCDPKNIPDPDNCKFSGADTTSTTNIFSALDWQGDNITDADGKIIALSNADFSFLSNIAIHPDDVQQLLKIIEVDSTHPAINLPIASEGKYPFTFKSLPQNNSDWVHDLGLQEQITEPIVDASGNVIFPADPAGKSFYLQLQDSFRIKIDQVGTKNNVSPLIDGKQGTWIKINKNSDWAPVWNYIAKRYADFWIPYVENSPTGELSFVNPSWLEGPTNKISAINLEKLKKLSHFITSGGIKSFEKEFFISEEYKPTADSIKTFLQVNDTNQINELIKKYTTNFTKPIKSEDVKLTIINQSGVQSTIPASPAVTIPKDSFATKIDWSPTKPIAYFNVNNQEVQYEFDDITSTNPTNNNYKFSIKEEIPGPIVESVKTLIFNQYQKIKQEQFIKTYSNEADIKSFHSLNAESSNNKFYKFIEISNEDKVDTLIIDKSSGWIQNNSLPQSKNHVELWKAFVNYMNEQFTTPHNLFIYENGKISINPAVNNTRGVTITNIEDRGTKLKLDYVMYIFGNTVPGSYTYVDPTSYFSVISPEFAKRNNKVPFTDTEIKIDKNLVYTPNNIQDVDPNKLSIWLNKLDDKYKIDIDGAQYLIVGTGYSPDFMYPVMSSERITPDFDNESLVYVTHAGMVRAQSTFIGGEEEEFFTGRFHDNVDKNAFMNKVEASARAYTSLPSQYKMIRERNDTNEKILLTPLRTVFAPTIVSIVDKIALWLTIFMVILTAFIAMVIVYRYIMGRRESLGILKANGINRWEIALSLTPFALIAAFLGGVTGYVVGILLQHPTIFLIHNYWSIPTPIVEFNWWTLLVSFIVPFIGITFFTILVVIWNLRHKAIDLMRPGLGVKTNFVARIMKKPFNKLSIITRFRVSVAFNSMGRLLTLSAIVASTVVALAFSVGVTGKFEKSLSLTQKNKNYAEKINYNTPTSVSGEYVTQTYDEIGSTDPNKGIYSLTPTNINTNDTYCVNDTWKDNPNDINGNPRATPFEQCRGDYGLAEGSTDFGNIQDINESTNQLVDLIQTASASTSMNSKIWHSEEISKFVMANKNDFATPGSNIVEYFDYEYSDTNHTIQELVNLYQSQDKLYFTNPKTLDAPNIKTGTVITSFDKNIKLNGSDGHAYYQYRYDAQNVILTKFDYPWVDGENSKALYEFKMDAKTYAIPHRMDSQNDDFFAYYSKNKVVVRELFDVWLGGAGVGQRPWNVLGKRLGSAQQAKSQQSYINFYKTIRKHLLENIVSNGKTIKNPDYDPIVGILAKTAFVTEPSEESWFNNLLNKNMPIDATFTDGISSNSLQLYGMIRPSYIVLFRYISEKYASEYKPYKITMGNIIPFGKDNEKFTHVDGDIININNSPTTDTTLKNIEITGIQRNSLKMTLLNNGNNINEELWKNPNINPIIISAYAAKYMNLKKGQTITFHNTNSTNLYNPNAFKNTKFTVVGIYDSFQGVNLFTRKDLANTIIGLSPTGFNGVFSTSAGENELLNVFSMYSKTGFYPSAGSIMNSDGSINDNFIKRVLATMSMNPEPNNQVNYTDANNHDNSKGNWYELQITFTDKKFLTVPEGPGTLAEKLADISIKNFNDLLPNSNLGPFTKAEIQKLTVYLNSLITNIPSGNANSGTDSLVAIRNAIADPSTISDVNVRTTLNNIRNYVKEVAKIYGTNVQLPTIKSVESKTFTSTSFKNLSKVMTSASAAILGAISIIAILILMVIAHITIAENEKVIATFKVLGFKNKTTIANLLSIYVPVILIGLAIAVPVSIGMLALFNSIVFSSAGILLSLQAQWWYYVVAVGAVALIMAISLATSWNSIKKIGAISALK